MKLICKIGRMSGQIVDYPHHIGVMLLADGRAIDPNDITEPIEHKEVVAPKPTKRVNKPKRKTRKAKK